MVSFVYLFQQIRQRYLMFDSSKYVTGGGGEPTRCHGVLDHGLHLHRNIPLNA